MRELTPDEKRGIEFRGELQQELGLVGRNITLVPYDHVRTTYTLGCDENAAFALAHVLEYMVNDDDVPPSYQPEIKYMRELFRTCTRQIRQVVSEYPKGIFDRQSAQQNHCGRGPCCMSDGHQGECRT